ncbi:hypothetical protein LAWI1_G000761 [Lachnellula willkommii]|uniref:Uncharacterized protein n=1 Tax=Lachnellula willkommii TaxID=215461 RepID=A0A559MMQ3_9HELO|nr:hypothetical protein LAWI1_G000761 [Lachnellula willkommii]
MASSNSYWLYQSSFSRSWASMPLSNMSLFPVTMDLKLFKTTCWMAQVLFPVRFQQHVAPLKGFCSSVRNLRPASTPATATATRASSSASGAPATTAISSAFVPSAPSSSSRRTSRNPGCSTLSFALSYCSSVSPGFLTMSPSDQAPCLCYSASSFNPSFFDNAVQTCADYAQTADPADYRDIAALEGFCSSVGDVLQNANTAAPTTRNSGSTTALTGARKQGIRRLAPRLLLLRRPLLQLLL